MSEKMTDDVSKVIFHVLVLVCYLRLSHKDSLTNWRMDFDRHIWTG